MKFGVIGIGSIGLRHIKNIKNLGFEVVGHDTNKSKASDLKKIGINFIKNKKEFLSFIDAGIISTPTEYHLDGTARLVGTDENLIIESVNNILINEKEYKKFKKADNPYGDGNSAKKILDFLINFQ